MQNSNNQNIKIGQKVVCINTVIPQGFSCLGGIKKGEIYTVDDIIYCPKCNTKMFVINEVTVPVYPPKFCTCREPLQLNAFFAYRFKPLDYSIISNQEFISNMVEERLDRENHKTINQKEVKNELCQE